jgi:hypothetical protein
MLDDTTDGVAAVAGDEEPMLAATVGRVAVESSAVALQPAVAAVSAMADTNDHRDLVARVDRVRRAPPSTCINGCDARSAQPATCSLHTVAPMFDRCTMTVNPPRRNTPRDNERSGTSSSGLAKVGGPGCVIRLRRRRAAV